jgi:uncharacterized protein (DUF1330 family)
LQRPRKHSGSLEPEKSATVIDRRYSEDMPGYVIVEIEVTDPAGYEEYKKLAGATVEKYGGEYVVRGGATETLEGDWHPKRIVVLKFTSVARAKEWLNCEEYREPRKMRHRTAKTRMIVVEGVS